MEYYIKQKMMAMIEIFGMTQFSQLTQDFHTFTEAYTNSNNANMTRE